MAKIAVENTQIELHVTKDYSLFNLMSGNRPIDTKHVTKLKRKIEQEGNLTSEFPVNLNEKMEVIDGQHRILALKELGYPVYYTITKGANLSVVRQINVGRKNWSWKDYAESFAAEHNPFYRDLLDFSEAFGFNFSTIDRYTNGGKRTFINDYQNGEYKVLDKGLSFKLFNNLAGVKEALPFAVTTGFAAAMYDILTHPEYDQKRMLDKLTKYGVQLKEWSKKADWLRNIEDVYNIGQTEATRVRFF